ncbi:uncharacterized protein LOC141627655 [Silene latifolia]|uniref:uncharacterized protein LOC141627655 n=1 Tax=Silene latifolia TaxID=37657 RepID=UPI003D77E092
MDLQKAYDTIEWDFLYQLLKAMKFPVQFRGWIYKYDLLIFCKGDADSIMIMLGPFSTFSKSSGLKMNKGKSNAYFNRVKDTLKRDIIQVSGMVEGKLPFRYLGVPTKTTRLNTQDCRPLIDKLIFAVQALLSKNKSDFITGECSMPEKNDKTYNQWIICDLLVLRWILHSIAQSLRENLQYPVSVKNLWSEIVERYGQPNILEIYEVQTTVLSMDPLPSINITSGLLQKIEMQKVINDSVNEFYVENSSYVIKKRFNNHNLHGQSSKKAKEDIAVSGFVAVCEHCNKPGYVIADCHRLKTCTFCNIKGHVLERYYMYKAFKMGKAKVNESFVTAANNVLIAHHDQDKEYADLSPIDSGIINSVMQQVSKAYSASAEIYLGTLLLTLQNIHTYLWIVDTGVSEHITFQYNLLHHVKTLAKPINVALPDGTLKKDPSNKSIVAVAHRTRDLNIINIKSRVTFPISHSSVPSKNVSTVFLSSKTTLADNKYFFRTKGIQHQRSIAGRPQQNGRVERKHRHLLNTTSALKFHFNVPINFWAKCLLTATYLINKMPTKLLTWKTPYEVRFGEAPQYDELRVFGSVCFATKHSSNKFKPRASKCVFLGYPFDQKGYKVYDL